MFTQQTHNLWIRNTSRTRSLPTRTHTHGFLFLLALQLHLAHPGLATESMRSCYLRRKCTYGRGPGPNPQRNKATPHYLMVIMAADYRSCASTTQPRRNLNGTVRTTGEYRRAGGGGRHAVLKHVWRHGCTKPLASTSCIWESASWRSLRAGPCPGAIR